MNAAVAYKPVASRPLTRREADEASDLFCVNHLRTDQIALRFRVCESEVERALHALWDGALSHTGRDFS